MKKTFKKLFLIGAVLLLAVGIISPIVADGDLDFKKVNTTSMLTSQGRTTTYIGECKSCGVSSADRSKFPFVDSLNVKNDKNNLEKIDSQVTQVGFNLIYGHKKDPMTYLGEIPFELATASEGELTDVALLKDLRYNLIHGDDSITWSSEVKNFISNPSEATYENLRKTANNETDVRLLAHLYGSSDFNFLKIFNFFTSGLVNIALTIIHYIFLAKRLDIDTIISIIDAPALGEIINQLFIGKGGAVSPFFILCIIGFIMCMTGAAYHYVKGNGAIEKARETFLLGLVAILIIGAALTNRAYTLSSPAANLVAKLVEGVAVSNNPDIDIFLTKSNNPKSSVAVSSLNQEAMIQKIYIDTTIEAQFGTNIENLKLGENAISSCSLKTFDNTGTGSIADTKTFSNNLGYYFWYANSSIANLTNSPKNIDPTGSLINRKFEQVLNCLQESLDKASASGDINNRHRVIEMVKTLAGQGGGTMNAANFLFALECILLSIILLRFTVPIVLSKFELLVSTLGLAVAGPLFLVNNKKTLSFAKSILYMFLMAMLKITIYEIIVMLVIYLAIFIMGGDATRTLLAIFVMVLGVMFAPTLSAKIKGFTDNLERSVAPELHNARGGLRSGTSRALNTFSESRFAGSVDEDDNVHKNALGRLAGFTADQFTHDGYKNRYRNEKQRTSAIKNKYNAIDDAVRKDYGKLTKKYENINMAREADMNKFYETEYGLKEGLEKAYAKDFKDINLDALTLEESGLYNDVNFFGNQYKQAVEQYQYSKQNYIDNKRLYDMLVDVDPEKAAIYKEKMEAAQNSMKDYEETVKWAANEHDKSANKLRDSLEDKAFESTKIKYNKSLEELNEDRKTFEDKLNLGLLHNGHTLGKTTDKEGNIELDSLKETLETASGKAGANTVNVDGSYVNPKTGDVISRDKYNELSDEEQAKYNSVRIKGETTYSGLKGNIESDLKNGLPQDNDTVQKTADGIMKNDNVEFENVEDGNEDAKQEGTTTKVDKNIEKVDTSKKRIGKDAETATTEGKGSNNTEGTKTKEGDDKKAEEEKLAQEKAEQEAKAEAERIAQEEAKKKAETAAQVEAERKAKEEAELKAKQEAERIAKEQAEAKKKAEEAKNKQAETKNASNTEKVDLKEELSNSGVNEEVEKNTDKRPTDTNSTGGNGRKESILKEELNSLKDDYFEDMETPDKLDDAISDDNNNVEYDNE